MIGSSLSRSKVASSTPCRTHHATHGQYVVARKHFVRLPVDRSTLPAFAPMPARGWGQDNIAGRHIDSLTVHDG
jgi:hypothetical protein